MRAAFFTLVGVAFFVFWVLADPSYEETASQSEWKWVLAFSGVLLLLAFALPMLAQLVGERVVLRVSLVPAAGVALSSFANILEDGLQLEQWRPTEPWSENVSSYAGTHARCETCPHVRD